MYSDTYDPIDYYIDPNFTGHSPDFFISSATDPELFLNIKINTAYTIHMWGQLHTSQALPLYRVAVELFEIKGEKKTFKFRSLGLTYTDCNGFYSFNIPVQFVWCYKIAIYNKNPVYNQILTPGINPCTHKFCQPCEHAFKQYIHQYPSFLRHTFPSQTDTAHFTTIYAACQYA